MEGLAEVLAQLGVGAALFVLILWLVRKTIPDMQSEHRESVKGIEARHGEQEDLQRSDFKEALTTLTTAFTGELRQERDYREHARAETHETTKTQIKAMVELRGAVDENTKAVMAVTKVRLRTTRPASVRTETEG